MPQLDIRTSQDAALVQQRLIELGYLQGNSDGLWGAKSRAALSAFKVWASLDRNDVWDSATELKLFPYGLDKFVLNFVGEWTENDNNCDGDRMRISDKAATTGLGKCEFLSVAAAGFNRWHLSANCTVDGERRPVTFSLARLGERLTWTTAKGSSINYQSCPAVGGVSTR